MCSNQTRSTGFTSLMYLVNNTHDHPEYHEQIKYILDNYPEELNKQNADGWTALMLACRNSNTTSTLDTVKLLLDYNPDLYLLRIDGYNVIYVTLCNYDAEKTIDLLLDHGFSINHPMQYNRTVLHNINSYSCSSKILKKLIDRIDGNITDVYGRTSLIYAIIYGITDIIEYFLTKDNLDLTIADKYNKTAYDYAIDNKLYKISEMIQNYDDSLGVKCALD
jgi:ankyrin repeat protein